MFAKLATLALILPYVAALTINPLVGASTGGTVTISWTASTTDPTSFSIQLVNPAFHNTFAIANNVQTAQGEITISLPQVPVSDGYAIEAIANNDVNTVYSQSGDFSVGAATSSSATGTSTSSSASDSTSSATTSASSTPLTTLSAATTTTPASSASASASTFAASSSTASASPSSFKSGAASFKLIGAAPAAALVLSVVAGAAMVF